MSIRTIQTRYKASSLPSTVLTTIDTNSPSPPGLAAKVLYLNMSTPRTMSPKPSSANTSTLSPLASPYRPKSNRSSSSSSRHVQNQHLHQQSQRAGARAGRGIPAAPVEVSSSGLVGGGSGIVEPTFGSLPAYQSTSRFDPFGDFTVSESTNNSHYFLSQPLRQSPPSSPPSSMTSFASNDTLHSSDATQPLGFGSGANFKPAYNHYYYYDPMTNSPTLAYGSPPVSSSSSNSNRFNHNRNRSNPNYRARNNGNHYNTTNNLSNNYNNNHGRRANSVVNPSFNHSPRPNSRSPSPPSPLTSPTKVTFPPSTVAFPSQGTQDPFADPVVPTAPIEPVPVRTRKRSNTISETRRSPSPPSPSTPPRSPSPPSVAVAEKPTVAPSFTPKKDNSAISKLVAAMLLNRVDAMGRSRCGKRVNSCGTRYVKSGLSRVVCVE